MDSFKVGPEGEFKMVTSVPTSIQRLDKRYTVLSLDGGGVRGVMTARILAEVEREIGDQLKVVDS
jgi:hypothetical protein